MAKLISYLLGFKISSTIYYSSIEEAITTFSIMSITTTISLIMFIHTIYKFFCEQIPLFDGDVVESKEHSKSGSSTAVTGRGRSSSATRSHVPSLSKTRGSRTRNSLRGGSKPAHSKEISFVIAGLTMGYLFLAAIYTFINWIIRLLMIFFEVNISCDALGYIQFIYVLIKVSFYVLFIVRLHLTFSGSNLAVKPRTLIIICVASVTCLVAAFIYFLFDVSSQYEAADNDCSQNANFNFVRAILPAVIVDTLTSIILLYLFIKKLSQLIRVQTSSMDSFIGGNDSGAMQRIINLILIMTKLCVLVCVYVIGSWLLLLLFLPILPGAAVMVDISIGVFCVIFCYEFHQENYDRYCFSCKWCCYHICFWWFIICKEESNATKRFGYCNIICCCLENKIDDDDLDDHRDNNNDKNDNNNKKEVMLTTTKEKPIQNGDEKKEEEHKISDNGIEAMIMSEISVPISPPETSNIDTQSPDYKSDTEDDGPRPEMNKVNSLSSDVFSHEKTNTFVINLNVDDSKITEMKSIEEENEDVDDDMDQVISKQKTNTFDYRAQRLKEMHALFFGDEFKGNKRRRMKIRKQDSKKKELMSKRFQSDFIHRQDTEDIDQTVDHQVKKSKTAVL